MSVKQKALRAAFPHTIPILTGFVFLGMSYGFLMTSQGFSFWYPVLISVFVFAGSMQFVAISLLLAAFHPLYALLMTLMVNARHIFYGLSLLEQYAGLGAKRLYMIFGLTDETFSVNCAVTPPEDVDRGWFMFFVTLLNQIYWVTGSTLGALMGSVLTFNTRGIDFALTALFVVIFLGQWEANRTHLPAAIGVGATVLCLLLFGRGQFLLPAMVLIVIGLSAARGLLARKEMTP